VFVLRLYELVNYLPARFAGFDLANRQLQPTRIYGELGMAEDGPSRAEDEPLRAEDGPLRAED
jgi:hypothetical protein